MHNTTYSPAIACAVPFDGTQHVLPQFIALQKGQKSGYVDERVSLSNAI